MGYFDSLTDQDIYGHTQFQQVEPEKPTWSLSVGDRIKSTINRDLGMLSGLAATAAQAMGADETRDFFIQKAEDSFERALSFNLVETSLKDVDSVGDFFKFGAETIVEFIPTFASMFLGGVGTASIAGRVAAKAGGKKAMEKVLAKSLEKNYKDQLAHALSSGAKNVSETALREAAFKATVRNAGAITGMAAYEGSLSTGGMFLEDVATRGADEASAGKAILGGAAVTGISLFSPLNRALSSTLSKSILTKGGKRQLAEMTLGESVEEILQESVQVLHKVNIDPNLTLAQALADPDTAWRLAESGVAGGLVGGIFGGGKHYFLDRKKQVIDDPDSILAEYNIDADGNVDTVLDFQKKEVGRLSTELQGDIHDKARPQFQEDLADRFASDLEAKEFEKKSKEYLALTPEEKIEARDAYLAKKQRAKKIQEERAEFEERLASDLTEEEFTAKKEQERIAALPPRVDLTEGLQAEVDAELDRFASDLEAKEFEEKSKEYLSLTQEKKDELRDAYLERQAVKKATDEYAPALPERFRVTDEMKALAQEFHTEVNTNAQTKIASQLFDMVKSQSGVDLDEKQKQDIVTEAVDTEDPTDIVTALIKVVSTKKKPTTPKPLKIIPKVKEVKEEGGQAITIYEELTEEQRAEQEAATKAEAKSRVSYVDEMGVDKADAPIQIPLTEDELKKRQQKAAERVFGSKFAKSLVRALLTGDVDAVKKSISLLRKTQSEISSTLTGFADRARTLAIEHGFQPEFEETLDTIINSVLIKEWESSSGGSLATTVDGNSRFIVVDKTGNRKGQARAIIEQNIVTGTEVVIQEDIPTTKEAKAIVNKLIKGRKIKGKIKTATRRKKVITPEQVQLELESVSVSEKVKPKPPEKPPAVSISAEETITAIISSIPTEEVGVIEVLDDLLEVIPDDMVVKQGDMESLSMGKEGVTVTIPSGTKPLSVIKQIINAALTAIKDVTTRSTLVKIRGKINNIDDISFSLDKKGVKGITKDALDAKVAKEEVGLGLKTKVITIQSVKDLPPNLYTTVEERNAFHVRGIYDKTGGRVFLIADNITEATRVSSIILHEIVGHFGVENILEEMGLSYERLWGMLNSNAPVDKTIRDAIAHIEKRYKGVSNKQKAQEVMAYLAEGNYAGSTMNRVADAIKSFLAKLGFNINLTPTLLRSILRQATTHAKTTGITAQADVSTKEGASLSVADTTDVTFEQKDQEIIEKLNLSKHSIPFGIKRFFVGTGKIMGNLASSVINEMERKAEKIAPLLHEMEGKINMTNKGMKKAIHPFLVEYTKMSKEDKGLFDHYYRNEDKEGLIRVLNKNNISMDNFDKIRAEVLDILGKGSLDVGLLYELTEDRLPRIVKDYEGLMRLVHEKEQKKLSPEERTTWSPILQELKNGKNKVGRELSDGEKQEIILDLFQTGNPSALRRPGATKKRTIGHVTPEMGQFFYSVPETLMMHIDSMVEAIETRKILGETPLKRQMKLLRKLGKDIEKATTDIAELREVVQENPLDLPMQERLSGLLSFKEDAVERWDKEQGYINQSEESLKSSIAALVESSVAPEDQHRVKEMLIARLKPRGASKTVSDARNIASMAVMGSFNAGITQLADLIHVWRISPTFALKSLLDSAVALSKKKALVQTVFSFTKSQHEFSTGRTSEMVDWLFTYTGLKGIDLWAKEATLRSILHKYKAMAGIANEAHAWEKFNKKWGKPLGEVWAKQAFQDLREGNTQSDVVLRMAFVGLAEFQPIHLSKMPVSYLTGGNLRAAYMLKVFALTQLNGAYHTAWIDHKNGHTARGVGKALSIMMLLALAGAGADEIKDFMNGRDDPFSDHVASNFVGLFLLNRYGIDKGFKQDAIFESVIHGLLPPVSLPSNILADVAAVALDDKEFKGKTAQHLPFIGRMYYSRTDAAQESYLKRRRNEIQAKYNEGGSVFDQVRTHNRLAKEAGLSEYILNPGLLRKGKERKGKRDMKKQEEMQ